MDADDDYPNDNRKATPRPHHGRGKIKVDISSILGAYMTEVRTMSESGMEGRPSGFHFDDGLVSFKINRGSGTSMVTMTFPEAIPAGSKVFMVSHGQFREIQGAVISDNTVTIPVRAGESPEGSAYPQSLTMGGDSAATANVVGIGSPDAAVPASSGGGCSATAPDSGNPAGALGMAALFVAGLLLRRRARTVRR
jgi:uncharacterized protein (TIGR03382 family)